MDNITLPAVLSGAHSLLSSPEPSNLIVNADPNVKKIVICITRDVDKDTLKQLAKFGEVISYDHDIHNNIDPANVDFSYLLIDMRQQADRIFYQKFIQNNLNYHIVLYKWKFETDMGLSFESEFSEFPANQANKKMYDTLLITPPIEPPSVCISFLGACARLGSK
jgi:hypothetical protein